jgi:hypothetical protein
MILTSCLGSIPLRVSAPKVVGHSEVEDSKRGARQEQAVVSSSLSVYWDQASWRRLTVLCEPLIQRGILARVAQQADSEDLVQEVISTLATLNTQDGVARRWTVLISSLRPTIFN